MFISKLVFLNIFIFLLNLIDFFRQKQDLNLNGIIMKDCFLSLIKNI